MDLCIVQPKQGVSALVGAVAHIFAVAFAAAPVIREQHRIAFFIQIRRHKGKFAGAVAACAVAGDQ